jgi:hypothetical protein
MKKIFEKKRKFCDFCKKRRTHKVRKEGNNTWLECNSCNKLSSVKALFSILFLISIISLSGCQQKKIDEKFYITFRVQPNMPINYSLEINNSLIQTGTLETSWNDLIIPQNSGKYIFYFWDANHYVDKKEYGHFYTAKNNETFTFQLEVKEENKKGNLSVTISEPIQKDSAQDLNLIFKANNGTVKKIAYCLFRSIGFIYFQPKLDVSFCDTDIWLNRTVFGNLSDKNYFCDNVVTKCTKISGTECYNDVMIQPSGMNIDNCYFLGRTLKEGEDYRVPIHSKTMSYFDSDDGVKVYYMDMDLSSNKRTLGKEWGYAVKEPLIAGEVK